MRASFKDIDFANRKVFVRVDFNVPLDKEFRVTDSARIAAAIPTIKKILSDGGSAIVASHLGRPKNGPEDAFSLKHILPTFSSFLPGTPIHFSADCIGAEATLLSKQLKAGEILLLENLRFHAEEEKGDPSFAESLASLADFYVNDAFGAAHRAHASTAVMARFFDKNDRAFGYLMEKEIDAAERIMRHSAKPFCAILGGAKVSDKILIIENLLSKADHIIIGGGMAFTFLKAQGHSIGKSLVEDTLLETALRILQKAKEVGCAIHLPVDFVIADSFSAEARFRTTEGVDIPDGWMGLDAGGRSIELFEKIIKTAKTILWNGPIGVFEMENFRKGTLGIGKAVAAATQQGGAFSLVGGGDSVAAVNLLGFNDKISYISTGGGALLEFFEGKSLPGIEAIKA